MTLLVFKTVGVISMRCNSMRVVMSMVCNSVFAVTNDKQQKMSRHCSTCFVSSMKRSLPEIIKDFKLAAILELPVIDFGKTWLACIWYACLGLHPWLYLFLGHASCDCCSSGDCGTSGINN